VKQLFYLSFLAMIGIASVAFTTTDHEGLHVGEKAPDFRLQNVDETFKSLDSYKDAKGYVVVFTCNHCPFSVMYEDRLIELHNKYASKGYPVVAINPNNPEAYPEDSFENMKVRSKDKAFPFDYLFDADQTIYPEYGAKRTPHVFLLDSDRIVQYIGAIDDNARDASAVSENYLENAIKALEAGRKPDPSKTKAIGCSIKV
jgi:peroxiredoxin